MRAEIDVPTAVNQWVDTTSFEARGRQGQADLKSTSPARPALVIERKPASPPTRMATSSVRPYPEGKKLKSDYTLEDIVNAFARVELEDVRKPGVASPRRGARVPGRQHRNLRNRDRGQDHSAGVRSEGDPALGRWCEATGEGEGKAVAEGRSTPAQRAGNSGFQLEARPSRREQADLVEDAKS